jgi:T5SS/PEP-CTERM-associated repeat protein
MTGDAVAMDTSNTYGNVASGNVEGLTSLTVASSATNVELEVSAGLTVSVQTNVMIGENADSSGIITLNLGAKLDVTGDLTVGGAGAGTLDTNGGEVIIKGALQIGASGVVDMNGGKIIVFGDQLEHIHDYLHSGADQIVPNINMATYAIYDLTDDVTVVRGPAPAPTPNPTDLPTNAPTPNPTNAATQNPTAPPTAGGGGGVVRSASCPPSGETVLTYEEGDTLELTASSSLCTLVEVDLAAYEIASTKLALKPVARSYSNAPWEAYAGVYSTLEISCSSSSCQMSPKVPEMGRALILKTYSAPSYSSNDLSARFLEKGTFGPTREEIASFTSPEAWMSSQVEMSDITSHRAFFRERLTHWHAESSYHALLHTNPCQEGARYRRYAFLPTDNDHFMEVSPSPFNTSLTVLSVDGMMRTVIEGPVQYGGSDSIWGDLGPGSYKICGWWEGMFPLEKAFVSSFFDNCFLHNALFCKSKTLKEFTLALESSDAVPVPAMVCG